MGGGQTPWPAMRMRREEQLCCRPHPCPVAVSGLLRTECLCTQPGAGIESFVLAAAVCVVPLRRES